MIFPALHAELNGARGMPGSGRCSRHWIGRLMRSRHRAGPFAAVWRDIMTSIFPGVVPFPMLAGGALALTLALPPRAKAVDSPSPATTTQSSADRPAAKSTKKKKSTKANKDKEKKSEQQFIDG